MKSIVGIILGFIFWGQLGVAQVTICEKNTILYFSCYKLNPDSTFSYQYIDGTNERIGIGTYRQNKKEIVFSYDSLVSPIINKTKVGNSLKTITINCAYILDSFPQLYHPVVYRNNLFFCDSSGQVTINNYIDGPILVHNYTDSILLHPQLDDCNNYQLYTHYPDNKFIAKGSVHVLEKKGKSYRRKVSTYFDKKGIPTPKPNIWKYIYFSMHPY
ncbi:hypothetical protein [Aureispira anguillae]|uniref:Uncharacterized protein n=1 Tax=Aureispira anguillae TaxID=2864201 RepID=A0A915YF76_9BACT|nr:hypothetical protein [Aureispira anguillae]BDS12035.1 hypothetical protein AsAng_0027500 [Aureispira anguillae]